MLTQRLDLRSLRAALALLAAAAIWACVLALHAAHPRPAIAVAGAFDLVVTASVAVYLVSRSRRGALATAALGATVAKLVLLPDAAHVGLAIAGGLELAVVAVLVVRARRARRAWRAARADGACAHDALELAFGATGVPPLVADVIATETTLIASAFTGWRRAAPSLSRFTVHGAWSTYIGVFVALTLVETPLVHVVLVAAGATTTAWILSALSIYGALWLVGDLHALRHGGVTVARDAVELRIGVRWRAVVPRASIVRVERGGAPEGACDLSILGADVVITLAAPIEVRGLFGRKRTACVLAVSADAPDALLAALAAPPLPE